MADISKKEGVWDVTKHPSDKNVGKAVQNPSGKHKDGTGKRTGRPFFSFCSLLAKSSIYKVLVVLGAMVLAETILFFGSSQPNNGVSEIFFNRMVFVVFFIAFGLVFFLLMQTEQEMGSQAQYTMQRFRLSGTEIYFTEVFYNLSCLLLVFFVQVWLSIGMLKIGEKASFHQTIFLAFYRIDFLHCLLPMADGERWLRNVLLLFSLAMGTACGFGKRDYILPSLTFVWTVFCFVHPIGRSFGDLACNILYILGIATGIRRAWELRRFETSGST